MIFQVGLIWFPVFWQITKLFLFRPFSSPFPLLYLLLFFLRYFFLRYLSYPNFPLSSDIRGMLFYQNSEESLVRNFKTANYAGNHSKVSQFLIANIDEIWANKLFKNRRKKISNFQIVGGFKGANAMWVGGCGLFAILIWCQILDSNTIGSNPSSRLFWKKIKYFWIFQGTNKCDPKHVFNTFRSKFQHKRSNFNKNCVELWFRVRKNSYSGSWNL